MPLSDGSTVLVPVDVSTTEAPDNGLLTISEAVDLVLLGYYPVPDQATPAQIQADHETEAKQRLERIATAIDREVTELVVFTHDRDETIDRVAVEYDCDAVLVPGSHTDTNRVFVPLRGVDNLDRIFSVVAALLQREESSATLFHATSRGEEQAGQSLLDDASGHLTSAGIDSKRVDTRLVTTEDPERKIVETARDFDLLVVGETEPSLTDRILGRIPARIVDEVDRPAFIVRNS